MRTDVALLVRDIARKGGSISVGDADITFDWECANAALEDGLIKIDYGSAVHYDTVLILTNPARVEHGLQPVPDPLAVRLFCALRTRLSAYF